ncbi:methyltransferase domain protein [Mycobacterium kansasii]|uniref:Methyltransferase domain protein n=1 Tax=Mycobacterium kansasii TaxID=1768 RepID=A0A1V3XWE0_MYCKA|nr:methyltransferase domain protein [Mycobacterium kansasii]
MTQPDPTDPTRFEEMYRDDRVAHGLPAATPWDIGGPQPVVQQLVALGAIRGEVLDPGTGPGHHAIYYAAKGLSATGIDGSVAAIERARDNARQGRRVGGLPGGRRHQVGRAGRPVRHRRRLRLLSHVQHGPELQKSYVQALHRATKPGARLYMFEFGEHDVNGFTMERSLSQDDFRQVLPVGGWEITYMGPTTYQINLSVEVIEMMAARNPDMADEVRPMLERFRAMEPWLVGGRVHAPFWEVHATRLD